MKTYYFFRVNRHGLVPQAETFNVTFEHGQMITAPDEIPRGDFTLEEEGRLLERIPTVEPFEQRIEIPVIFTHDDHRLLQFGTGSDETFCFASPDRHLVEMVYLFFTQGKGLAINAIGYMIDELREGSKSSRVAMINIFKIVLKRHDDGYALVHNVIYFDDAAPHEQCRRDGGKIDDPIYTLDLGKQTITELINPQELGPAKHETATIISDTKNLEMIWKLSSNGPVTIFTNLSLPVFTDLFHKETCI